MLIKKNTALFFCFFLLYFFSPAQEKLNIKFGKVSVADFDLSKYKFDTTAAAVVIADIGDSHYESRGRR